MPVRRLRIVTFCIAIASLSSWLRATESTPDSKDIPSLINALADPDSAHRQRAADALADLGAAARPDLLHAARGDNPEIRAQAARVLRKLPWSAADDPLEAQRALDGYGDADDRTRIGITRKLDEINAFTTLLRLFNEEPSDGVRWVIVWWLKDSDDAILKKLRSIEPATDDAPALLLAAEAWMECDRAKALNLYTRAIDADATRPTNDSGILAHAYRYLITDALERQDFDAAAALLRKQVPRERSARAPFIRGDTENVVPSLVELMALHEYFGPLRGYGWDMQTWAIQPDRPTLLSAITTALAPLGFAPPLPTGLTAELRSTQRYDVSTFLYLQSLNDAAELELRRGLLPPNRRSDFTEARSLALLSLITANRDDDATTAELLDRAFTIKGRETLQVPLLRTEDDMRAEFYFRRAKLAQASGNKAKADREVDQLMDFTPSNTDAVIKTVVWLKETGRVPQAQTLFKRVYDDSSQRLKEATVRRSTLRNDLAWLCSRCGENLDEAVKLAEQAVADGPANGAFLDTLAEAKYRTGQKDEAIALETRAIAISSDTKFMREQLARFRAGRP